MLRYCTRLYIYERHSSFLNKCSNLLWLPFTSCFILPDKFVYSLSSLNWFMQLVVCLKWVIAFKRERVFLFSCYAYIPLNISRFFHMCRSFKLSNSLLSNYIFLNSSIILWDKRRFLVKFLLFIRRAAIFGQFSAL